MARPDAPHVIYLDSNTLCRFIIGEKVETIGRVIQAIDAGQAELVISPLLLVECRGQSRKGPVDEDLEQRMRMGLRTVHLGRPDPVRRTVGSAQVEFGGVGADALAGLQMGDRGEIFGGELEAEHVTASSVMISAVHAGLGRLLAEGLPAVWERHDAQDRSVSTLLHALTRL